MEDLGKSLPMAEGFIEAEQAGESGEQKNCLNCGTPLAGKYCGNCGQRNLPARQDLGDLLINFVSSFYSFESKFFKTFQYLLFRPGKIVTDYNSGKRDSYYHPARMYVFLSFIFFLLLSIFTSPEDLVDADSKNLTKADSAKVDSIKASVDSIVQINTGGFKIKYGVDSASRKKGVPEAKTVREYDSIQNALPENKRDDFISRFFQRKAIELEETGKDKEKEMTKKFYEDTLSNIPRMLFFLMPIFALFLKLLYFRRDYFYSEHLIFTVFYYDFIYLVASLIILVQQVSWLSWLQYVLYLWILIYLYKAMRNVYKQRRAKTITKFFLLLSIVFVTSMIGFVALFVIAFARL